MTGEYRHNIDDKGRLFIPAKLREKLGSPFYIAEGFDKCVNAYSVPAWEKMWDEVYAKLAPTDRIDLELRVHSKAQESEPDAQGRIILSPTLRKIIGIPEKGRATVMMVGTTNHVQIWSEEGWQEKYGEISKGSLRDIFKSIGL